MGEKHDLGEVNQVEILCSVRYEIFLKTHRACRVRLIPGLIPGYTKRRTLKNTALILTYKYPSRAVLIGPTFYPTPNAAIFRSMNFINVTLVCSSNRNRGGKREGRVKFRK